MRCEPCGGLSFECGRSFKDCSSWTHCQLMLRPEECQRSCGTLAATLRPLQLSPFRDATALSACNTIMAAFNEPLDEAGMARMQWYADEAGGTLSRHSMMRRWRTGGARVCQARMARTEALKWGTHPS
jgi:hypothetical protein